MHNPTPLETAMYLKELERQVTSKLGSTRAQCRAASPLARIRTAVTTLLRRVHAMCFSGRSASLGKLYSSSLTSSQ
jgi:hypothetical protein